MVKTSGYDTVRTNQGPLRRTLALKQHCLIMCIDVARDGPCVDKRGIDSTVIPYLDHMRKPLTCTVSELIDKV